MTVNDGVDLTIDELAGLPEEEIGQYLAPGPPVAPEVDGGPPHIVHGMFAELFVA